MKKSVCYVLCYRDPRYVRTHSLLSALQKIDGVEIDVIINRHTGLLRYIETPLRLLKYRLTKKPDVFFVGFRAHEIFWTLYPMMRGSTIIFDEFINIHDWLVSEHKKLKEGALSVKLLDGYMRWVASRSRFVLEDTDQHAVLGAEIHKLPPEKFFVIPAGTDETVFYPRKVKKDSTKFEVFFYGSMLPLHGANIILDAIELLFQENSIPDLHVTLIGGKEQFAQQVGSLITNKGLHGKITYIPWVTYDRLPAMASKADVALGGPFGGTNQARRVVTGKTYQFLALGVPTIVGITESHKGFFKHQENSILVEQKNPRALADTLIWAAHNRAKLPAIGKAGMELYEAHYSSDAISARLKKLLEQI